MRPRQDFNLWTILPDPIHLRLELDRVTACKRLVIQRVKGFSLTD